MYLPQARTAAADSRAGRAGLSTELAALPREVLVLELQGQSAPMPLSGIKKALYADTRWAITDESSRKTIGSTDPAPERRLDGANRGRHTTQLGGSGMKTAHRRTVDCGDADANGDRP